MNNLKDEATMEKENEKVQKVITTNITINGNVMSVSNAETVTNYNTINIYGNELMTKTMGLPKPGTKPKPKQQAGEKNVCPVEVTFTLRKGITMERIDMLLQFLQRIGWMDNSSRPDAFRELFTGGMNQCRNIWNRKQGKGKLRDLFQMMLEKNYIKCPKAYGYLQIVESHFMYITGEYVTGLRGGAHAAGAEPVYLACEKILNGEVDDYLKLADNIQEDYFKANRLFPDYLNEDSYESAEPSARKK